MDNNQQRTDNQEQITTITATLIDPLDELIVRFAKLNHQLQSQLDQANIELQEVRCQLNSCKQELRSKKQVITEQEAEIEHKNQLIIHLGQDANRVQSVTTREADRGATVQFATGDHAVIAAGDHAVVLNKYHPELLHKTVKIHSIEGNYAIFYANVGGKQIRTKRAFHNLRKVPEGEF